MSIDRRGFMARAAALVGGLVVAGTTGRSTQASVADAIPDARVGEVLNPPRGAKYEYAAHSGTFDVTLNGHVVEIDPTECIYFDGRNYRGTRG